MVDTRDIAEVAAIKLIRRDQAGEELPVETLNLVGPDTLTGEDAAAAWQQLLSRPVIYGEDNPDAFEANMAELMPRWMAYEMRLMAERYVSDGCFHRRVTGNVWSPCLAAHYITIAISLPHSPASNLDLRLKDKPVEQCRGQ